MLTKKDMSFLKSITTTDLIVHDDNLKSTLLEYEKKYNMNSFDAYFAFSTDEDFNRWKRKIERFVLSNGDFTKVNKISPVKYHLVYNPNKDFLLRVNDVDKDNPDTIVYLILDYDSKIVNVFNNFRRIVVIVNEHSKKDVLFDETLLHIMYVSSTLRTISSIIDKVYVDIDCVMTDLPDELVGKIERV